MKKRYLLWVAVLLMWMLGIQAFAETTVLPTDVSVPQEGCTFMGVEGSYIVDAQAALRRINAIRREACEEGVINPSSSSGAPLTMEDYREIKWSSDLEYIARLRAAESAFTMAHKRTNGTGAFNIVSPNGVRSYGEVIAWNDSKSMLMGIEQWYGEKTAWVKQTLNLATGHYTAMIDPNNKYVGLGTFYSSSITEYTNTTVGEFSGYDDGLDETIGPAVPECIQTLEVQNGLLTGNYTIQGMGDDHSGWLKQNKNKSVQLRMVSGVTIQDYWGDTKVINGMQTLNRTMQWQSSDPSVVSVDAAGNAVGHSCGNTVITATDGEHTASISFSAEHVWQEQKYFKRDQKNIVSYLCAVCGQKKEEESLRPYGFNDGDVQGVKVAVGGTYASNGLVYRVKSMPAAGEGKAVFIGTIYENSDIQWIQIPDKVKIGKRIFKVTEVQSNALKKSIRLTTVILGRNIEVLGKNAFAYSPKLKKIQIKSSRLRKVGKNAFKNIAKKAVIRVPGSRLKAYKRLFKKSTGFKKPMKIRK
ncbi:MAG: CAP domain-containing protein [Eubacteriales bacterium]|nr:CAP domain-containing protein [Eubacteriales bacterium]